MENQCDTLISEINELKGIKTKDKDEMNEFLQLYEKIKLRKIPKKIKEMFPKYNTYKEYGNYFFSELYYPEFPFILVYEYDEKYQFF